MTPHAVSVYTVLENTGTVLQSMKQPRLKHPSFSWREDNHFQLYVDGAEIFPAMLAAIAAAQKSILLEMYLVESGKVMTRFVDALIQAAQRNVAVYLLFDGFGSRGLKAADRRRLKQSGAHCAFYNPLSYWSLRHNLFRDHRKLMVVDGSQVFVGGFGITDEFSDEVHPAHAWHDVAVHGRGPIVSDWVELFRHNWESWVKEDLTPIAEAIPLPAGYESGQAGRVAGARPFGAAEIQRAFVKRVLSAERRVWMMTAYFVPSLRLRRALRLAARRGADVRLLLPGPITDHPGVRFAGRRFFYTLLNAGVRIFEYQPRFLHAKALLCDDWVSLGSSNVDRWNLRWNLEANQEIEDSVFAADVHQLFEADFQYCQECRLESWPLRPLFSRFREWFWGGVDHWLDRMGARLRK
jgi:phosphatidylserine/phosphatidylglycerophosphate/cardiolipin synthase-like enzyme